MALQMRAPSANKFLQRLDALTFSLHPDGALAKDIGMLSYYAGGNLGRTYLGLGFYLSPLPPKFYLKLPAEII